MNNIVIIDAKWFAYCCIIHVYGISELINLSEKSVLGDKDSIKMVCEETDIIEFTAIKMIHWQ